MSFTNFTEYLNQKGKMQEKPIVDPMADTSPTAPPRPPKAVTKGKGWKDYKAHEAAGVKDEEPAPYKGPGTDPGQPKYEKGLVYQGDQELIYKPKTDDQTLKTDWGKTKTEAFIEKTRSMKPDEYASFVLQSQEPNALKKILEAVEAISKKPNLAENLVREIKRKGNYDALMNAVLDQPETYKEFAIALANENKGKEISRQIAKSVNEIAAESDSENKLRPEHNLVEALAAHKASHNSMVSVLNEEFGRKNNTLPRAASEAMQLANQGQLNDGTITEIANKYHIHPNDFKDYLLKANPELNIQ